VLDRALSKDEMAAILGIEAQHDAALEELLVNGRPGHEQPQTLSVSFPKRVNRERFEALLHDLPPTILRAKGFIALDEDPSLYLFQFVEPNLVSLTPFSFARRPGLIVTAALPIPYGVFIGTQFDEAGLRAALDACVA
jgi:G3E family GTPase